MWFLLSRRIRTWLVLAVAVPIARRALSRIATARAASHPGARSTAALHHADSTLARVQARRRSKDS